MQTIPVFLSRTGTQYWSVLRNYSRPRTCCHLALVLQATWPCFFARSHWGFMRKHCVPCSGTKFDSINWVRSTIINNSCSLIRYFRFKWTVRVFGFILIVTLGIGNIACRQHLRMSNSLTYFSQVSKTTASSCRCSRRIL
jgi:hypothetical protein